MAAAPLIDGDDTGNVIVTVPEWREIVRSGDGDDVVTVLQNVPVRGGRDQFGFPTPANFLSDFVDAQDGDDIINIFASGGTYNGGFGDDLIFSSFDEVEPEGPDGSTRAQRIIYGDYRILNDDVSGHGNDTIFAGPLNEFIDGGGGFDVIDFTAAASGVGVILGDLRTTHLTNEGNATGGSGNDRIFNVEGINGSLHDDFIFGNDQDNLLEGNAGDDNIRGAEGNDTIRGDSGDDTLVGEEGADRIFGGSDNDQISGGAGRDQLFGDNGNDDVETGPGNDFADGGNGADQINFRQAPGPVFANLAEEFATTDLPSGSQEVDIIEDFENVLGSIWDDFVFGNAEDNRLDGFFGSDTLIGLDGDDTVIGGDGNDLLFGNMDDDLMDGGDGRDRLAGGFGSDFLFGGFGDDTLVGGPGSDNMLDGSGVTVYVWNPADFSSVVTDTIFGFRPLFDTLRFNDLFEDPDSVNAVDVITFGIVAGDTFLNIDLSGTSAAGSAAGGANTFVKLDGFAGPVDIAVWDFFGVFEFT